MSDYFALNRIAQLRPEVISRQQSSYDRTGGNLDGLWLVGLDENSTDQVLLDTKRPGVVTRMWFTGNANARLRFYFDGETTPRLSLTIAELTAGTRSPFLSPLVANDTVSSGGFTCYVPIPYAKSLKILGDGVHYYNINYDVYPSSEGIVTFTGEEDVTDLVNQMNACGAKIQPLQDDELIARETDLPSHGEAVLFEGDRPGGIASVRLRIPELVTHQITDDGRTYTGSSRFTMAVSPENNGVLLKKRVSLSDCPLSVRLKVDGADAGTWNSDDSTLEYTAIESSYEIPSSLTQGKQSIEIESIVADGRGEACDYYIECYSKVDGRYRLTDTLDVGPSHTQDEEKHGYSISGPSEERSELLTFDPRAGQKVSELLTEDGRAYTGSVEFTMKIDPQNQGVRLTKLIDAGIQDQKVKLLVDGEAAGTWATSGTSLGYRWEEFTYTLPAQLTEGKDTITIRSEYQQGNPDVNEFNYKAESLVGENWLQTDYLDVGAGHTESEQAHGYTIDGQTWQGTNRMERFTGGRFEYSVSRLQQILQQVWIHVSYDGEETPSVSAPIGSFFGMGNYGLGECQSLMVGMDDQGEFYCTFPMPYEKSCSITLSNQSGLDLEGITSEVIYRPSLLLTASMGYFKTQYHEREEKEDGYFTFLETTGSGHLAGVVQSSLGTAKRGYLESDEVFYVDGSRGFSGHGTGTEDMYNGGWYFSNGPFTQPLYGNPYHDAIVTDMMTDRTVMMRLYLSDRIAFRDGMVFAMEDMVPGTLPAAEHEVLVYYYHRAQPSMIQTDELILSEESSRASHAYACEDGAEKTERRQGQAMYRETVEASGMEVGGSSSFTAAIDPKNEGVLLHRLFYHTKAEAAAKVYVDDAFVGIWTTEFDGTGANSFRYASEDSFVIPASMTQGKKRITLRFETQGEGLWQDYRYTVHSLAAEEAPIRYGDINEDDAVTAEDALHALQHTVGLRKLSGSSYLAGDVDGSSAIDAKDALYILQHTVELIDQFPIEQRS